MRDATKELQQAFQIGVVALVIAGASLTWAAGGGSVPAGAVSVTGTGWEEAWHAWDRQNFSSPVPFPTLAGTCVGLTGTFGAGTNLTCYFAVHLERVNATNGSYLGEVGIQSVTADPPFQTTQTAILGGGFQCVHCDIFAVSILLPPTNGSYVLEGFVEFDWIG